ncbi:MAG: hypothetical protein FWC60_08135, partial [Firmicutes bacterium]|nr:hypothetical protein [Bacillota bacterium]
MNYRLAQLNQRPANQYLPAANLRVAPYQVEQILAMQIQQRLNQHTSCYFKALLPEALKDTYAKQPAKATNILISVIDDTSGEEYILFQGLVQQARIQAADQVYYLEVHALSHSSQLDIEKKNRSFQDKQKPYADLIKEIVYPYPDGDIIDQITDGARTEALIMQHRETDWELLIRLASRFNSGVIGNAIFDAPKIYFGLHTAQNLTVTSANYALQKNLRHYRRLAKNGVTGISEGDFLSYAIETDRLVNIGDQITFQDRELYVAAADWLADKGLLVSRLTLTPPDGLKQPRQTNPSLIGAAYSGNILAARNDLVQVTLNTDADQGHDPGAPCWFPYSTIYSSRDGSGWYCMPETGDLIRIYFPDSEDDHAYAINSVHEPVNPARPNQNTAAT